MSRTLSRVVSLVIGALVASSGAWAQSESSPEAPTPASATPAPAPAGDAAAPAASVEPQVTPVPAEPSSEVGLFERSVSAASPATVNVATASESAPFQLGGYTRGDIFVGKVPGYQQGNIKAGYGELALVARSKKASVGDAFAEVRLRYGMMGESQQENTVDVREAYVNAYLGHLDLRLGKQIIVWGRADLLNPTNNLTPFDFRMRSPIEDDRRIGNVGARAFLRLSPVRLEGVWLPTYVPNQLPQVTLPEYVTLGDPTYPKPELDRGLLAGRVHLELPSIEMSASYLHGYAPMPGLNWTSITFSTSSPGVVLSRTAYKQQVIGFDFSTALGDIVALRGEAAYRRPYDYQDLIYAARPDLQYALGADHTFGSVSVIAQYLGRYTFDWSKESGPADVLDTSQLASTSTPSGVQRSGAQNEANSELRKVNQILFSQTAQVQHLATVRVEWLTAHETLSISALGMFNFTTKEWMAAPKIGYRMSDSMTAYVGAEILTGPTDTLFGLVDQQLSAGYAELRSTF